MSLTVSRTNIRLNPDYKKVIARFLNTGDERSLLIIQNVVQLKHCEAEALLTDILIDFAGRYKNSSAIFLKHFNLIKYLLSRDELETLTEERKLLLGAYFTMEYSIEAAALFNPSIVADPDQGGVAAGHKKVIVSFRATGESHISSMVFRRGVLDENAMISLEPPGKFLSQGEVSQADKDNKMTFRTLLDKMELPPKVSSSILNQLKDLFSYKEIEVVLKNALSAIKLPSKQKKIKYNILDMVSSGYELQFAPDSLISERVIFPVTAIEKNGIEDARWVIFAEDDGTFTYIATYTAYNGTSIVPQLILTTDFFNFKIASLQGKAAVNKNLALFPRKINGRYAMLSRIDGINNYLMYSDDLFIWEEAVLLQEPKYPWEFIQIGNAGSPIETDKGWLVITHGVGAMRKYCLGASLFDINDPSKQLGRLEEPFLVPNEDERDGYVPNVVYSCGSIIHGDKLLVPYAVSDHASSFATLPLKELLDEILGNN
jgi:predicted GH43/DUF377 family glycosyl hydrolase